MKKVTSISGGQSSAYIAANYQSDYLVFSLVRTDDKKVLFKDRKIAKRIEDRIQKPFIGTLEDDTIVYTILDLEQYIGKEIKIVSGITFDEVIKNAGGYLPNQQTRFCTTELKIRPIFHWWAEKFNFEPVEMAIGYRANECGRRDKELAKLNKDGLSEFKATFEKHKNGRNKWVTIGWRKPYFPLIDDNIYKQDIVKYWRNKPVRFAKYNNCVGCFHRMPHFLSKMQELDPVTFQWFIDRENENKGFFKKNVSYQKIKDLQFTTTINFDSEGCDSGYCGF